MGCDEIRTFESENEQDNNEANIHKNLCSKILSGLLLSDSNFHDTIIKNQEDLDDKLRSYIPTKIKKDNSDSLSHNLGDLILTKAHQIDFTKNYLIAINGVNRVLRVEEDNGNYLIFHDKQPGYKNKYIALVVERLPINPGFNFASPKQRFLDA